MNPLVTKHLYSSVRRNRFFWLLSAYLGGIGVVTVLLTATPLFSALFGRTTTYSMLEIFSLGRNMFWISGIILIIAAGILVPITALGALAGERDNHTLDLLLVTTLRPVDIVSGKMLSACITGIIYLLAPLPLVLTSFWLGGVSILELVILNIIVAVVMIFSCSLALFISSVVRKTLNAVLIYYMLNIAVLPVMLVITILLGSAYDAMHNFEGSSTSESLFIAVIMQYGWVLLCGLHPLSAAIASEVLGMEQHAYFLLQFDVYGLNSLTGGRSILSTVSLPSPWLIYTSLAIMVSSILIWLTVKQVNKPDRGYVS
jgi:hypothetical protein